MRAVQDELTEDGLVLRYRVDETDDGLSGEEGTFAICSFWLVSALSEIGDHEQARDLCEKLLSYASPLGLYAEEIDPRTGRHLGNFPQAFTHLALINAVMHVIRTEQMLEVGEGFSTTREFDETRGARRLGLRPGLVHALLGHEPLAGLGYALALLAGVIRNLAPDRLLFGNLDRLFRVGVLDRAAVAGPLVHR